MVHADGDAHRCRSSWPVSPALQAKLRTNRLRCTARRRPIPTSWRHNEIIVSAGGGDVAGGMSLDTCLASCYARSVITRVALLLGVKTLARRQRQKLMQNAPECS